MEESSLKSNQTEMKLSPFTSELIATKQQLGQSLYKLKQFPSSEFTIIFTQFNILDSKISDLIGGMIEIHKQINDSIQQNYSTCLFLLDIKIDEENIEILRSQLSFIETWKPIVDSVVELNKYVVGFCDKLIEIRAAYNVIPQLEENLKRASTSLGEIEKKMKKLICDANEKARNFLLHCNDAYKQKIQELDQSFMKTKSDIEEITKSMQPCFNFDRPSEAIKKCKNHPSYKEKWQEREHLKVLLVSYEELKNRIYQETYKQAMSQREYNIKMIEEERNNLMTQYRFYLSQIVTVKLKIAGIPEKAIDVLQNHLTEFQTVLFMSLPICQNIDSSLTLTKNLLSSTKLTVETIQHSLVPLLANFVILDNSINGCSKQSLSSNFDNMYSWVRKQLIPPLGTLQANVTLKEDYDSLSLYC